METAGIDAFVTKPIKASPLQAALASVLGTTLDDRGEEAAASAIDPGSATGTRCGSCWQRTTW